MFFKIVYMQSILCANTLQGQKPFFNYTLEITKDKLY